MQQAKQATI